MLRSPRVIREEGRVASAWIFSIVGHLAALGLGGLAVAASLGHRAPAAPSTTQVPGMDDTVEIQLPTLVDGSQLVAPPPPALTSEPLARGGGEAMPRLDTGHKGRGGTDTSPTPAINLADRDDDILLQPELLSRLDRSQVQRIRASSRRASREDWRASREPMELTFLAQGKSGPHIERRPYADTDPSAGGRAWGQVLRQGGALGAGALPPGVGELPRLAGNPVEGAAQASAGRGVRDGTPGEDHRDAAQVAHARPMVNEGNPSVPATARDRPTDNQDSGQDVHKMMQSILQASNAGGAPGPGQGGERGPGAPGAGGTSGNGSASHALGTGAGPGVDVDPRDKRRMDYLRQVDAKLGPHTGWRQLISVATAAEGVQGVVVVTFTILGDGSVTGVSVTRSSGVAELDENYRRAILKAAPFPPLPAELGPTFRWARPLDLRNPIVRPRPVKAETL